MVNARISLAFALALACAGVARADVWQNGDLTTYGEGVWGGIVGIDPGATLLTAKFDTVYAATSDVIVGSTSGSTMIFTDPASVLTYMPSIGPYAPLNGSDLNPITTASGAFGGDVLALEFNVDFSDAGFLPGTSGLRFGDLVLESLTTLPSANGLTVRQFLGDVNTLLGGGSTTFSIADLGTTLSDVNASFSNGFASSFAQDHLVAPTSGSSVPEPSSWMLLTTVVLGLGWSRRRLRRCAGASLNREPGDECPGRCRGSQRSERRD